MKFIENQPPRKFKVGGGQNIEILDCGKILLESNEMVTFVTSRKKEFDFTAKDWGFYATPSINGRLLNQGFKTALVKNQFNKYFIMVVNKEMTDRFFKYLVEEKSELIEWIDEK